MTSYKLCLTVLVLTGVSVTANSLYNPSDHQRRRRDNSEEERSSEAPSDSESYGLRAGYRFRDEYFLPEASKTTPTKHKSKANGCERVVKDSMVCMVCKDPKTNEKYEQCSYVADPNEKAYTYAKSSAFGNPGNSKQPKKENKDTESPESSDEAYGSSETSRDGYEKYEASKPPQESYSYEDESRAPSRYAEASNEESGKSYPESLEEKEDYKSYDDKSSSESSEDPAETSDCRRVQKDGQTCTICKDPKTGSDLERCSSSYRPEDDAYEYGKSEKYSYPTSDDSNENYEAQEDDKSTEASANGSYESSPSEFHTGYLKSNDDNYRKYDGEPGEFRETGNRAHPGHQVSRSAEHVAPSVAAESKKSTDGKTDCREVQKDTMTCTVCTDPKTGGNFQKCSYAYQPNDKVYKFSKSNTFGYPEIQKRNSGQDDATKDTRGSLKYVRELETKQVPHAVKTNGCKEVQRDSKICTVCEDPITGESSEQCAYSYKPKEKHFTYSKSKSFGSPQKEKKGRAKESVKAAQEESRQVPRWSEGEKENVQSEDKADGTNASPCKEIQKDSMSCTVCKDPKTGASSEQCAYSSEPKEKLFTYSKSKSFGSPKKTGVENGKVLKNRGQPESGNQKDGNDSTLEQFADGAEANPCKQVLTDGMTCTICKDPTTGENSEHCAYSSKPKGKHFTYSNSKSFGNPRKRGDQSEESRHVPRRSDDRYHDFEYSHRPRGFSKPDWDYDS